MTVATSKSSTYSKDPDSVIDHGCSWVKWLALSDDDDEITSSEWLLPDGLGDDDLTIDDESHTATQTTVWLSKGVLGTSYKLVNRVTTAQGRTEDDTLTIRIRQH